ncbi:DNA internalization-related competence protein ComEC/Rec2 [Bacterioplanoides sp.]|uniref:DNA internalization-related competence protein ComEC/Rec2 n=1 Tax=Bacterioplanoides sp. TaxID=2066072 RepID=UPI003AFFFFF8
MRASLLVAAWLLSVAVVVGVFLPTVAMIIMIIVMLLGLACLIYLKIVQPRSALFCLVVVLLGLMRGHLWLNDALSHRLPTTLDRSRATLELTVEDVEQADHGWRLSVTVLNFSDSSEQAQPELSNLRKMRLNWYPRDSRLARRGQISGAGSVSKKGQISAESLLGARIRADLVLRAPRRFANPLPYDYEAYLLIQGIDAIGYIRQLTLLSENHSPNRLLSFRHQQLQKIDEYYTPAAAAWLKGLVLGEGNAFSAEQWRLAANTGTLHLLVVSGLHMGMVAALALLLAGFGWRIMALLRAQVMQQYASEQSTSISAVRLQKYWYLIWVVMACSGYALLSGGGIAVYRAFLMLLGVWLLWFSVRRLNGWQIYSLVVAGLLFTMPLIFTQAGFQYSVLSVGGLLLAFSGRKTGWLSTLIWPQLVVFFALVPLVLWWLAPLSFSHIVANLIAIPLVTFVLLPACLVAVLIPAFGENTELIGLLNSIIASTGQWFWYWLEWQASLDLPLLQAEPTPLFILLWLLLMLMGLRKLSFPVNTLLALLPLMLLVGSIRPSDSKPFFMMADVGQGLALIASDGQQTLVYDTGPRYSSRFDAGSSIVVPLLRQKAISPDVLIVSHSDNDHSGGEAALLAAFSHVIGYYGQPDSSQANFQESSAQSNCHNMEGWQVLSDVLRFRFLHYDISPDSDNNQSCVVQLQWLNKRILLPGDIDVQVEKQLVERHGQALKADILIAPHHGSATSSSALFINTVQPQQVWVSAGFNHRFGHPHKQVVARYQQTGVEMLNTAESGAVWLDESARLVVQRQRWQPRWLSP